MWRDSQPFCNYCREGKVGCLGLERQFLDATSYLLVLGDIHLRKCPQQHEATHEQRHRQNLGCFWIDRGRTGQT